MWGSKKNEPRVLIKSLVKGCLSKFKRLILKSPDIRQSFLFFIDFANNQVKVIQKCFKIGRGMLVSYTTYHISVLVALNFNP